MRLVTRLPALLAAAIAPGPAVGHAGGAHAGAIWHFEPWSFAGLVLCIAIYAAGRCRATRRAGRGRVLGAREIAWFAAGLAVLAVALLSPVDTIGGQLFSMHMVQHLLLMLVAAPLLIAGALPLATLWALPRRQRRAVGRWWSGGMLSLLLHPVSIWVIYAAVFLFWHVPGPYRWAVESDLVHGLEHLSILFAGMLFWSVVLGVSRLQRVDHGARLLFVATAAVLGGLPGALMILSPRAFYAVHADDTAAWGLTLLEDQQLAGLIMWIPGGLIYLAAASVLFLLWLRSAERRAQASQGKLLGAGSRSSLAALAIAVLLAGCDEKEQTPTAGLGDPQAGAELIAATGCGSCHIIPGITGAEGLVGPPLNHMARRIYIAGLLRNTPDNMVTWLRDPQSVVPGNAMPDMELDEQQARDITAYLYTLR